MVSLLHISFVGLLMFVVVLVQSKTLVETSNDVNETKSSTNNEQLYELYQIMRSDPRLASVSNQEIVSYIYQNFVLGNADDIDLVKAKNIKQQQQQRRHRHRKINQVE